MGIVYEYVELCIKWTILFHVYQWQPFGVRNIASLYEENTLIRSPPDDCVVPGYGATHYTKCESPLTLHILYNINTDTCTCNSVGRDET